MQNIIKMPFLSACVLTFLIIKKFKRDKNKKVKKTFYVCGLELSLAVVVGKQVLQTADVVDGRPQRVHFARSPAAAAVAVATCTIRQ